MVSSSVSNVELFRVWRDDDDLDLNWILSRILQPTQTPAMKAGEAFHSALEEAVIGEAERISFGPYVFHFECDCDVPFVPVKELRISSEYNGLTVRGRVDCISGLTVSDYKTTAQFDPDRLLAGYQWRYYLDMTGTDIFRWDVFVLRETDDPLTYLVTNFHQLEQRRYPELHKDCLQLASDYLRFAKEHVEPIRQSGKSLLEIQLERSLGITDSDITAAVEGRANG